MTVGGLRLDAAGATMRTPTARPAGRQRWGTPCALGLTAGPTQNR